jgi:hypothetical protein
MGNVYARLIHKNVYEGIDTPYASINDVQTRYQAATRIAWNKKYGIPIPE